jgi:hypothetical protein
MRASIRSWPSRTSSDHIRHFSRRADARLTQWRTRTRDLPRHVFGLSRGLVRAEILDVQVGAETDVVRQVPSHVIRIRVDRDLIGVPQPIVGEAVIVSRDAEVETAEPETSWPSAGEPEDVARPEAAAETTVRPGMVEVIVAVVPARVVPNPLPVRVDVRCSRMSVTIPE